MRKQYKIQIENGGIISGDDVRTILQILPELKSNFQRRKQYDEYYYSVGEQIKINAEQFGELTKSFVIKFYLYELTIVLWN